MNINELLDNSIKNINKVQVVKQYQLDNDYVRFEEFTRGNNFNNSYKRALIRKSKPPKTPKPVKQHEKKKLFFYKSAILIRFYSGYYILYPNASSSDIGDLFKIPHVGNKGVLNIVDEKLATQISKFCEHNNLDITILHNSWTFLPKLHDSSLAVIGEDGIGPLSKIQSMIKEILKYESVLHQEIKIALLTPRSLTAILYYLHELDDDCSNYISVIISDFDKASCKTLDHYKLISVKDQAYTFNATEFYKGTI